MFFRTLLCAILALVLLLVDPAESTCQFIETLPTGSIDWTQGVVVAKGALTPALSAVGEQAAAPSFLQAQQAQQAAVRNILETLEKVRMDAGRRVMHMMALDDKVGARVLEMAEAAQVVEEARLPDGTVEITVQLSLLGSFAQLMLPEDIKQVEPIRSVQTATGNAAGRPAGADSRPQADDPDVFSGLVIDARGIGARPAMAPVLVDESGKEVYGSPFVSREYAVQRGVCAYVRSLEDPAGHARVAPRPLWVKGLRTLPERDCDIVISNADAARLRGASAHLDFLRQCRVIIILD